MVFINNTPRVDPWHAVPGNDDQGVAAVQLSSFVLVVSVTVSQLGHCISQVSEEDDYKTLVVMNSTSLTRVHHSSSYVFCFRLLLLISLSPCLFSSLFSFQNTCIRTTSYQQ